MSETLIGRIPSASLGLPDNWPVAENQTAEQFAPAVCSATGGKKDVKADRYDLFPPRALEQVALVYGLSCKDHGGKYEPRNWERGYPWGWSFRSLFKHAFAALRGEWVDPESGLPHLAHAAWHCLTLLEFYLCYPDLDDRSRLAPKTEYPFGPGA